MSRQVATFAKVNTYAESDLIFGFPDSWTVRQFDRTTAYRSVSGHGLKGVDFLALDADDGVWLVEVKNFRRRDEHTRMLRRDPEALARHVGTKFTDTRRLIRVMRRAMDRKWWMGIHLWWQGLRRRGAGASHYVFWQEVARRVEYGRVTCLLWLETPEKAKDYNEAVREALLEHLPCGDRLIVAETDDGPILPVHVLIKTAEV